MGGWHGKVRAWSKLFVTLLAVIAMAARGVVPMPTVAHAQSDLTAGLRDLGATLCHSDGGAKDSAPAGTPFCDHCRLCSFSLAIPPVIWAVTIGPTVVPIEARLPAGFNADTRPRAPPGRANTPRAPPLSV